MPLATIYDPRESHLSSLAEEAIHYAMPDASASAAVQGRAKERSLSCEKVLPGYAWLVLSKTGPFFCTSL